ncbi:MAG TPA: amidohydrolase family protein [Candidatus Agrococcus pullicola]|uniref:Amidohydrolase family protein n=1 Tax=Candidatus Agrococcus pullicola TaxID=2838429 RepID=A0A9D2C9G4_9MICO|nr:amidohydrolase family protein [Candidatus Agrococcus pullicola]
MGRVDAHLHIWQRPVEYSWLSDELAPINRSISAAEARAASKRFGCERAVLVQAADTDADTEFMLALAERHDWIVGVVGWVPIEKPDAVRARLAELAGRPLVGIRALVHDQPDAQLLDAEPVRESLRVIAGHGLAFDVPDAYPHQLPAATRLARDLPELTVVLDHMGKPPAADREGWEAAVRAFAALPNTAAKLSGLHHGGKALPAHAQRQVWDLGLEHFGPARLMLGSDFPMPLLGDGIEVLADASEELLAALTAAEREAIELATATRIYGLEASRPRA